MRQIEQHQDEDLLDYPSTMLVAIVRMMIEGAIWKDGAYLAEIAATNDHSNYEAIYMLAFCTFNNDDMDSCRNALNRLTTTSIKDDQEIIEAINELRDEYS